MRRIMQSHSDEDLLAQIIGDSPPPIEHTSYAGYAVLKPWGYEFEVFDTEHQSVWLACLNPGQAVSLHCHSAKSALFIPLSEGITFRLLHDKTFELDCPVLVDRGVFHSQENNGDEPKFFLEYEWPSRKTDLVRYTDRYGREKKGYEGGDNMVPLSAIIGSMPEQIRMLLVGRAA